MPQLYTETLGAGPDLVLLHGWGMNSTIWQSVLPPLAQQYRITCIDLPGHGRSLEIDWPSESVIDLLLAVAPSRACWMGWSLGGMLATMVAARYPERINALVTVASNLRFTQTDSWPSAMPEDQLVSFAKELGHDSPAVLKRFIALQFLGVSVDKVTVKRLQREVAARPPSLDALRQGFDLLRELDLRCSFAAIKVPMLALFGRLDRLVPVQAEAAIRRLNPAMQTHIFTQAGHAPFMSHPTQFLEQVTSFVRP
ncbi:MAG: pimeloyl-[acyl-carrier protein] methyl ester esterase [Thiothrix sp.]|nr:MAG: pimeloyl-[acyl-carrier protein] methyl ester esterase [Thiothrix sp.]